LVEALKTWFHRIAAFLVSCVTIFQSENIRIIEENIDFYYEMKLSSKQRAHVKGEL